MTDPSARRTLVKSPPELWAEVSQPEALARHLGEFGEIRITRLDPETTVAWEGERASGTVHLEPSSWGTKVTLTASPTAIAPPEPEPTAAPRASRWGRFLRRRSDAAAPGRAEPEPAGAQSPESDEIVARLGAVLDDLGAAHHRPFSR